MTQTKDFHTQLTYRSLNVDDIDEIIKIDEKIVRRKRSELFRKQLHEQILSHGKESLGAFIDEGKLIGYVIAETIVYIYGSDDLHAFITLLGVDPDFQDQGVGTALTKRIIAYFSQKGVKSLRTICAWDWGDLVEFFSNIGFKPSNYLSLELDINKIPKET